MIAIAFFGLVFWGIWRFYTNGSPPADPANPPDLRSFATGPVGDAEESEEESPAP
jgi:hypothetical protein